MTEDKFDAIAKALQTTIIIWLFILGIVLVSVLFIPIAYPEETERNELSREIMAAAIDCIHEGSTCRVIELDERYLTGTDSACLAAGQYLLGLFERYPRLEHVILINDGWVPSLYRDIDETWARCLADEDPQQICETYDRIY